MWRRVCVCRPLAVSFFFLVWHQAASFEGRFPHQRQPQELGRAATRTASIAHPQAIATCPPVGRWEPWYAPHGQTLANSARIGPDTGTGWTSVLRNIENALPVQKYIGGNAEGGHAIPYRPFIMHSMEGTPALCVRVRLVSRDGLATAGAHAHKATKPNSCCVRVAVYMY